VACQHGCLGEGDDSTFLNGALALTLIPAAAPCAMRHASCLMPAMILSPRVIRLVFVSAAVGPLVFFSAVPLIIGAFAFQSFKEMG